MPAKKGYHAICASLRQKIVSGAYRPAERLPTHRELIETYNASLKTIHRAMEKLQQEGFICSRGTLGMFVTDAPPHLCRFGIAIPPDVLSGNSKTLFWQAINLAAQEHNRTSDRKFEIYHLDAPSRPVGTDYERLIADIENERLAGVLSHYSPPQHLTEVLARRKNIVNIALATGPRALGYAVYPDVRSFYERAIQLLVQHKRKKIAFMMGDSEFRGRSVMLTSELIPRFGLHTPSRWIQANTYVYPEVVAAHIQLLLGDEKHRPEALIVADDNLVEPALAACATLGIRIPDDLELVAYCNFPAEPTRNRKLTRIGFDMRALLLACLSIVDARAEGKASSPFIPIPALFESEIQK